MRNIVLVTGATGFVGRHVLRALARREVGVRAVVRRGRGRLLTRAEEVESVIESPDLFSESQGWWAEACQDIDTIIHLAWYAEPGKYLTSPLNLACLTGTVTMAAGASMSAVRRFVGVGTCLEYDTSRCLVDTGTALAPQTLYAATKAATFLTLSQSLPSMGVDFAWCRLFSLYGEGEDPRRLVAFVRQELAAGRPVPLSSGTQIRDYLDVAEAGQQIVALAMTSKTGAFNVCSGQPVTVRQLAENIADQVGGRALLRFGERPARSDEPPCIVGVPSFSMGALLEASVGKIPN